MLQPNQQWCWYTQGEYLAIELGNDMCFQTAYKLTSLISCAAKAEQFTLEQHSVYSAISQTLETIEQLSNAEKTQIAINGLALCFFGKPIAAKSWYFELVSRVRERVQYQIAYLKLAEKFAEVIILQFDTNSAYCMLLDKALVLDDTKTLGRFSPIKVMMNRLFDFPE